MQYFWAALITLWLVVAGYFYINYVIFHKFFGKAGKRKNKAEPSGAGDYDFLVGQKVAADVLVDVADAMIEYIVSNPDIHVDTHKYCTILG